MSKILLLIICSFTIHFIYARDHTKLDSLIDRLAHEDDNLKRGELYLQLANHYEYSDLVRSYDYLLKVRDIAKRNNIHELNSRSNLFIANLLIKQGKYNEALGQLNKELTSLSDNTADFKYVGILVNIGAIYYQIQQYDKALSHLLRAKELLNNRTIDNSHEQYSQIFIGIYNNIANVYDELNDNPKALVYYKKALLMAEEGNVFEHIGVINKNIGDLYIEMKHHSEALPFIKESITVRKNLNDYNGLATSYYVLGLYYYERKQSNKAVEAYEKSLHFGFKANSWLSIKETSKTLSDLYKANNNYKQAQQYFEVFHQYSDSLLIQNSEKQLLSTEFDFKLRQRQKQWDEKRHAEQFYYLLSGIGLLVLAAFLLLLFFLSKAREKRMRLEKRNLELENYRLEQDLKLKRKELTTNVMYLVRKNELIKEVSDRLMNKLGTFKPENQKVIKSVMVELQHGLDNDIWEEFEVRFNQVHSDFYDSLRVHYPGLTPNEVKLSAFLRLNMSSKEISAITHQSIRSIEVARTRLRKKLNLTNTDVGLVTFLNKY